MNINMNQNITVYREMLTPLVNEIQLSFRPQQEQVQAIRARVGTQMSDLDAQLATMLFVQLRTLGLFSEGGSRLVDMQEKLPALYHRWLDESIVVLLHHGWIHYESGTYHSARKIDLESAWNAWDQQKGPWLLDENRRAQVQLVEIMLRALPDIMQRKRLATDAMFPNSSLKLVEGIYKNNLVADYFNEVLSDVLLTYLKHRLTQDPQARFRILEIGAGTGGTSARLFPKLRPYQANIEE